MWYGWALSPTWGPPYIRALCVKIYYNLWCTIAQKLATNKDGFQFHTLSLQRTFSRKVALVTSLTNGHSVFACKMCKMSKPEARAVFTHALLLISDWFSPGDLLAVRCRVRFFHAEQWMAQWKYPSIDWQRPNYQYFFDCLYCTSEISLESCSQIIGQSLRQSVIN